MPLKVATITLTIVVTTLRASEDTSIANTNL